jgi:hypothetical protein
MLDSVVVFFTSGALVAKIAIYILIFELVFFAWWGRKFHNLALMVPNVLSGLAMIGALAAAMVSANPVWILVFLSLAFAAHLADLWLRLGRK